MFLYIACIIFLVILGLFLILQFTQKKQQVARDKLVPSYNDQKPDGNEQHRKAIRKGELGEYKTNMQLNRLPEGYKTLHDLLIRTSRGLTQIDHVVISPYGCFVIETKNYEGWIFGDQHAPYWTQVQYNRKHRLYSPLRQNYGHVQALKEILKMHPNLPYIPIVTFSRRCELRNISSSTPVIYDTELENVILKQSRTAALPLPEVETIYRILSDVNILDPFIREEHLNIVRQKAKNKTTVKSSPERQAGKEQP